MTELSEIILAVGGPDPTRKFSISFYDHGSLTHIIPLTAQDMNYTVVINAAVWLGALAYYYIDARKWFTGPKITLDTDDLTEEQQVAIREEGLDVSGLEKEVQVSAERSGSGSGSGEDSKEI